MNNGFLLVPGFAHPINIEHSTTPVPVPPGTAWVRFSLVAAQPMRGRPQFGCQLQIWWTDSLNRQPLKRDLWNSYPKDSWSQEEIDSGLPISGHAVDSSPGMVPYDAGPFGYVVEGAPAVNQLNVMENPPGYPLVFLKYTIFGGNNGSAVYVAVVLEALDADGQPLEFA
jgi:hypothetical protein